MDLTSKLHVGEAVELIVDGKFFLRTDEKDEKYMGYVMTLTPDVIGLSVTPQSNKYHGYTSNNPSHPASLPWQTPNIVEIESRHVKSHRVL